MKYVILGGVAAGTKAAAKLKRCDRTADVKVYTKGADISYAGCGLPYYVGDVTTIMLWNGKMITADRKSVV